MPQLIIKVQRGTEPAWHIATTIGEWDSKDVVVPHVGNSVVTLDKLNKPAVYLVQEVEHLYAYVLDTFRLYHIILYATQIRDVDPSKYTVPRKSRPARKYGS